MSNDGPKQCSSCGGFGGGGHKCPPSIPTLETSFSFGLNHKERAIDGIRSNRLHGNQPVAYLGKFLEMFRPHGYATRDDSWGELEKILDIVHKKLSSRNPG